MRPIISYCNSPLQPLAKFLKNILNPVVGNSEHHVKNSTEFSREISDIKIEPHESMVSFDVTSLFTSIPIELAVELTKEKLENNRHLLNTSLSIENILIGINMCLHATYFQANN